MCQLSFLVPSFLAFLAFFFLALFCICASITESKSMIFPFLLYLISMLLVLIPFTIFCRKLHIFTERMVLVLGPKEQCLKKPLRN